MWNNFQNQYYQSLINAYSTYRTQGLKTSGAFTLDLDKIFISLSVSPKSPEQISEEMIQESSDSVENLSIWDFLAAIPLEPAYRRIAILGRPGSGKSKLLEHLTLTYARNTYRDKHPKAPKLIPILLQVNQIIDLNPSSSLEEIIVKLFSSKESTIKIDIPPLWFEERLNQGKCLVMFDGLDEIPNQKDQELLTSWIDEQMQIYSESIFIITSRPDSYKINPLKEARIFLEIKSWNSHQIANFIRSWYLENEILRQARKENTWVKNKALKKAKDLIRRIKNSPSLSAITLNPLLLTALVTFEQINGGLPKNRVILYREICNLLLIQRQKAKGLCHDFNLNGAKIQYVLQVLALQLMIHKQTKFNSNIGKKIIKKTLVSIGGGSIKPEDFLKYVNQISGLLVQTKSETYQFTHLCFQEYLAAMQIKENKKEQILVENISDPWWAETIRLYSTISDSTLLVLAAWKKRTVLSMTLAYDCLEECLEVNSQLGTRLEQWLEEALESANPEISSFAAQVMLSRRLK